MSWCIVEFCHWLDLGKPINLFKLIRGGWTNNFQFSSFQSLSHVWFFATPWTAALQASQSFTVSWSLLKLMSIELVMPSTILSFVIPFSSCLQSFPASQESALHLGWPAYWSFSFSISPSNEEHSGLISFRTDWLDLLQSKGLSRVFSNTTVQKHQFFDAQPSLWSYSHIHTWWLLEKP